MPPLHLAVKVGGRDIVHLLLKHGADPALKDQVLSRPDCWLAGFYFTHFSAVWGNSLPGGLQNEPHRSGTNDLS